jgi:hypothetical protein
MRMKRRVGRFVVRRYVFHCDIKESRVLWGLLVTGRVVDVDMLRDSVRDRGWKVWW